MEVPKRNILCKDTKEAWVSIVGEAHDYSEQIKTNWRLDEYLQKSNYCIIAIPKNEVETLKYNSINNIIRKMSKNKEMLLAKRSTMEIFFPDYASDARELFQIDEVRKWFVDSVEVGMPWFYFLVNKGKCVGLQLLLSCTCLPQILGTYGKRYGIMHEKNDIKRFYEDNFYNLNCFTDNNDISVEINKEISMNILSFFNSKFDEFDNADVLNH